MIIDKKQINKKDGRTKKERKKETNKQTKNKAANIFNIAHNVVVIATR